MSQARTARLEDKTRSGLPGLGELQHLLAVQSPDLELQGLASVGENEARMDQQVSVLVWKLGGLSLQLSGQK